jgi:LL-diaminopimelate aminotransferase
MHISNTIQSLAPYAFAEVDKLVDALKAQGITPIDFGVGDPIDPTPQFIRDALKKGKQFWNGILQTSNRRLVQN